MTNSNVQFLKPAQVDQMRDATVRNSADYLAGRNDALLALLYDTGLRRSELAQLRVDNLDLDDGVLWVPAALRKDPPTGGEPSPLNISLDAWPPGEIGTERTLRTFLSSRWRDSEFLFPSRKGDRLTGKAVNDIVKKAAEEAQVRPHGGAKGRAEPEAVSAHSMRHSVAYRMLRRSDAGIYDVKSRLGHSSVITTERRYAHLDTV
jgi:integrase